LKTEYFKEQLYTLLEFTEIINSTLDINDLMNIVMDKAKSELEAEACSILFYNDKTNKLEFEIAICNNQDTCETLKKKISIELGQGIAGWTALNKEPLYIEDVRNDKRFYSDADKITGFITKSIIAVPLIGRRGLIGVAEIINPERTNYDKDIFVALCKQFAIAIENALLYKESLERERLKHELEIASSIQKSFLPDRPVFTKKDFFIKAVNIPAYMIGGDLYDFVDLSNDKVDFIIGDISGKGISAALYMAKLISDFRHISVLNNSVTATIAHMNNIVNNAPMGMFITAIYMSCNVSKGHIEYINAGHLPFLKIGVDGVVNVIDEISGPPLGVMEYEYQPLTIELQKGEALLLITDGVIDATGMEGKHFGFNRLLDFVKKHHSSDRLLELLIEDINVYSRGFQRNDDITILELRRL